MNNTKRSAKSNTTDKLLVLVDSADNEIGTMEKIRAHVEGKRHRAFSILIFDYSGRMLVTQRAPEKYHSGGLWTNACCSHQRPGEATLDAAHRRLMEELGISTQLSYLFSFEYKAFLDDGLIEHELDHVLAGFYDDEISPSRNEVQSWKYVAFEELVLDMQVNDIDYTSWFKIICSNEHKNIVKSFVSDHAGKISFFNQKI